MRCEAFILLDIFELDTRIISPKRKQILPPTASTTADAFPHLNKVQNNPTIVLRSSAATAGENLLAALLDMQERVSFGGRNAVRGRVAQGGRTGHDGVLVEVAAKGERQKASDGTEEKTSMRTAAVL